MCEHSFEWEVRGFCFGRFLSPSSSSTLPFLLGRCRLDFARCRWPRTEPAGPGAHAGLGLGRAVDPLTQPEGTCVSRVHGQAVLLQKHLKPPLLAQGSASFPICKPTGSPFISRGSDTEPLMFKTPVLTGDMLPAPTRSDPAGSQLQPCSPYSGASHFTRIVPGGTYWYLVFYSSNVFFSLNTCV